MRRSESGLPKTIIGRRSSRDNSDPSRRPARPSGFATQSQTGARCYLPTAAQPSICVPDSARTALTLAEPCAVIIKNGSSELGKRTSAQTDSAGRLLI
jgi:hypothetical protein